MLSQLVETYGLYDAREAKQVWGYIKTIIVNGQFSVPNSLQTTGNNTAMVELTISDIMNYDVIL